MKKIYNNKNLKNKLINIKGFTLMEIIIVIAIIAILAVIAIPSISGYVEVAKETNDLQVASNIITATQTTVAFNTTALPEDGVIEVFWATGYGPGSPHNLHHNKLIVREAGGTTRISEFTKDGYTGGKISADVMEEIQISMIETMTQDTPQDQGHGYLFGVLDAAKSKVAEENNFAIHIHTGTGEVAMAYSSQFDGTKNAWIDEIGLNITPAP